MRLGLGLAAALRACPVRVGDGLAHGYEIAVETQSAARGGGVGRRTTRLAHAQLLGGLHDQGLLLAQGPVVLLMLQLIPLQLLLFLVCLAPRITDLEYQNETGRKGM